MTTVLFFSLLISGQENSSLFDGKSFELAYFLKDNIQEELDLVNPNDPSGNTSRGIPNITFSYDANKSILESDISGYCNSTGAKYEIETDYLLVKDRAGVTLSDCGNDEDIDYFFPIKGQINWTENTNKVYYKFDDDGKELTLWITENHKLVFTQKVLSVEKNTLEKAVTIYPNPTKDIINIAVKQENIKLSELKIFDNLGKEILRETGNFTSVDVSTFASGIYFLKITNDKKVSITKKIIKK